MSLQDRRIFIYKSNTINQGKKFFKEKQVNYTQWIHLSEQSIMHYIFVPQ